MKRFTVKELVEVYGVSENTVLGWIHRGRLEAVNISDSNRPQWRITEEAINKFEASRITKAPAVQRRRKQDVIEFY